jgi:hypothetical protein
MRIYNENLCKGSQSIQNQINLIAKDEGGANWGKLITDKKWREETRMKLQQQTNEWCDYKANTCMCGVDS